MPRATKPMVLWKGPKKRRKKAVKKGYQRPTLFWDGKRIGWNQRRIPNEQSSMLANKKKLEGVSSETSELFVKGSKADRNTLSSASKKNIKLRKPTENVAKAIEEMNQIINHLNTTERWTKKEYLMEKQLAKLRKSLRVPEDLKLTKKQIKRF